MTRLKLKNHYHDAIIRKVRSSDPTDILLDVDLCGCCNASPGHATLSFLGLRNLISVQQALELARHANGERGYVDEIIGIGRAPQRGYVFDLMMAGNVYVDAQGIQEM
jgi:hypothetical protein